MRITIVENKYIEIIKQIYENHTATIKPELEGKPVSIKKEVRQGDRLSLNIFKLGREKLRLKHKRKGTTNLRFADDIIMFVRTVEELQEQLLDTHNESN